jgi:hypothetical protein
MTQFNLPFPGHSNVKCNPIPCWLIATGSLGNDAGLITVSGFIAGAGYVRGGGGGGIILGISVVVVYHAFGFVFDFSWFKSSREATCFIIL